MKRIGLARSVVTAALVSAAFVPAAHAAGSFSNMYVFGDSLSDVGTEVGLFPGAGPNNRWTYNGAELWDEYIAGQYGIKLVPANPDNPNLPAGGNAYAQGGAAANGPGDSGGLIKGVGEQINVQVANFLKANGGKADPNALYSIWIGGNDVAPALAAAQTAQQTALAQGKSALVASVAAQSAGQAYMTQAAQITAAQVAALKAAGAQHIIVANVPRVDSTPLLFDTVTGLVAQGFYAKVNTSASAQQIALGVANALGQASNTTLVNTLTAAIQQGTAGTNVTNIGGAGVAAAQAQLNAGTGAYSTAAVQAAGRAAESAMANSYAQTVTTSVAPVLLGALTQQFMAQGMPLAQAQAAAAAELAQLSPGISSALVPTLLAGLNGQVASNWQTAQTSSAALISQAFNPTESAALAKSGVIEADVYALMSEVFKNPQLYGFDNVTGYACPAGTPANNCTSSQAGFDNSKRFFFSDDLHPSPAATQAIYQYIYSILQAPYYAAQLPNAQETSVLATQNALDNRYIHARSVGAVDAIVNVAHLDNKFDAGTDYLGSNNNNTAITLGADTQFSAHYSLGVAATQVKSTTNFGSSGGSFSTSDYLMSFFSRYENGPWTVSGDTFFGSTRFSNIYRNIQIGADNRVESASTEGSQAGLRLIGSYSLSLGQFTVSPTVSASYREGKVGGYTEASNDGSQSSNMQYLEQRVDSTMLGGGVKVDFNYGRIKPYASAMYYGEAGARHRTVSAGLQTASTLFDTTVENPDHSYTQLDLGSHFELSKTVFAYANFTYTGGLTDQRRNVLSAGLQASF